MNPYIESVMEEIERAKAYGNYQLNMECIDFVRELMSEGDDEAQHTYKHTNIANITIAAPTDIFPHMHDLLLQR